MMHGCDGVSADPNLSHACACDFTVKNGRVRCGVHRSCTNQLLNIDLSKSIQYNLQLFGPSCASELSVNCCPLKRPVIVAGNESLVPTLLVINLMTVFMTGQRFVTPDKRHTSQSLTRASHELKVSWRRSQGVHIALLAKSSHHPSSSTAPSRTQIRRGEHEPSPPSLYGQARGLFAHRSTPSR